MPFSANVTNNNVEGFNCVLKGDIGRQMTNQTSTLLRLCDAANLDSRKQGKFATAPCMNSTEAKRVWQSAQA